jgi:hypothetical protein
LRDERAAMGAAETVKGRCNGLGEGVYLDRKLVERERGKDEGEVDRHSPLSLQPLTPLWLLPFQSSKSK